MHHSSET